MDIKSKELEYAETQKEIAGLVLQFKNELQQGNQSLDGRPETDVIMQRLREQNPLLDCDSSEAHIRRLREEIAAVAA